MPTAVANYYGYCSAGGSGGGIRLVANTIQGKGTVQCAGASSANAGYGGGGNGWVRIECVNSNYNLNITPAAPPLQLADRSAPTIWPPSSGPSVSIVSIGGMAAPADPRAGFAPIAADVAIQQCTTTTVVMLTTNVESASRVTVRVTPRSNGNYTETAAYVLSTNSVSPLVLQWVANVPVQNGFASLTAHVKRPGIP